MALQLADESVIHWGKWPPCCSPHRPLSTCAEDPLRICVRVKKSHLNPGGQWDRCSKTSWRPTFCPVQYASIYSIWSSQSGEWELKWKQWSVEGRQCIVIDEMARFHLRTLVMISSVYAAEKVIKAHLINIYSDNQSNAEDVSCGSLLQPWAVVASVSVWYLAWLMAFKAVVVDTAVNVFFVFPLCWNRFNFTSCT